MDIQDRRGLKIAAARRLEDAPNAQRIVLLWAGASAALSLLVSFLSFLLDGQIESTGGLSGIGLRSLLETAQSLLSVVSFALLPFWNLGYTACTLRFARGEETTHKDLLRGFRRFRPALRMMVLRYFLYMGIVIGVFYIGLAILSMTPLAGPFYSIIEGQEEALLAGAVSEEVMFSAMESVIPMLVICGIICVVAVLPLFYRLRLAEFRIMDEPECRARAALRDSGRMMRRRRWKLALLDLSFWWYFLAELVAAVLCYGDTILAAIGVELPFGTDAAFFLFYVLGMLAQVLVIYLRGNYVQTTYAMFYQVLRQEQQTIENTVALRANGEV